jgi:hypothetical protein
MYQWLFGVLQLPKNPRYQGGHPMFRYRSTKIFLQAALALFLVQSVLWIFAASLPANFLMACLGTLPPAVIGWFILSLVLYLRAQKQVSPDLPALKSRLIVASVLLGFLIAVVTALVAVFAMAIAFM